MQSFIQQLPKAELHIHIEGSLEPEMMFSLAEKNKIKLPYANAEAVRKAYQFQNLQSFLDLYHQGCQVLQTEDDFYDLTTAYLNKVSKQNVKHAEIFFVPQCHTGRGIAFTTVFSGIHSALVDAKKMLGIRSELILCFNRHLSEEQAMEDLTQALPYKEHIIAVGLESSEKGNPPDKFVNVFFKARQAGFLTVAHAGEEGPADYMWQAIRELEVERIDHGVRCLEDPKLVEYLQETQLPLTVCPLSNIKLCVFESLKQHPIKQLLDLGINVSLHSDDPAYFGGYILENYIAVQQAFDLNKAQMVRLAKNSFVASFLPFEQKEVMIKEIDRLLEASNA